MESSQEENLEVEGTKEIKIIKTLEEAKGAGMRTPNWRVISEPKGENTSVFVRMGNL